MNEPVKELYIFCEGQTEQGFCQRLLQPWLFPEHDGWLHTIRIAHSRKKGVTHRGGVNKYQPVRDDIHRLLRNHQRPRLLFTSMIDLYALPGDFPGVAESTRNRDNPRPYVEALELAFQSDIGDSRFIAHLQLHEFETLLFSEPEALLLSYEGSATAVNELRKMADQSGDIEKINDSPETAPSKRIITHIPRYKSDKTTVGPDVAEAIGMDKLLASCAHFRDWVVLVAERLGEL